MPPKLRVKLLATADSRFLECFDKDVELFAHPAQLPPACTKGGGPWTTWLFLGGRGAGKTWAGARWVRGLALGLPPFATAPVGRIALVGETEHDVREVMVEGISGVLAAHARSERPAWIPSRRRIEWRNGAIAQAFSADDPESLRGPQFGAAWADELAKWRRAERWSSFTQSGGREFFAQAAIQSERRVVFRCRWVEGVTSAYRVACDGVLFNIEEVRRLGRKAGLELHCTVAG